MITQRIATALKQQDWALILIELVLVVGGVLIALEVDQWNEARAEDEQEIKMLIAQRDAVKQDIIDMEDIIRTFTAVSEFGGVAVESLEGEACTDQCWPELVAFFHASQWTDVGLTRAVYDEMKRTGLPRDMRLREKLTNYYSLAEQSTIVGGALPRYRELVRSLIPAKTQQHLWAACFRFVGRDEMYIGDCVSAEENSETRETLKRIKTTPEIQSSLNYWLSTQAVIIASLHQQIAEAELVIEALSNYVENEE